MSAQTFGDPNMIRVAGIAQGVGHEGRFTDPGPDVKTGVSGPSSDTAPKMRL